MSDREQSFEAFAFHPDLGTEAVAGRLVPAAWTLRFESEAAQVDFPWQELQIECEAEENRLFFRHPKHPGWSLYTFEHGILEHRAFTQRAHLRHQIIALVKQQHTWRKPVFITLGFLAAFAVAFLIVSLLSGWMVRRLAAGVPLSWERSFGEKAFARITAERNLREDPDLTAKLSLVATQLLSGVSRRGLDFQFHVIDDPEANAFALPGGHVCVQTGMFRLAEGPEELAGVLAHEMAHVTERHHFRKRISTVGPYLLLKFLVRDESGLLGVLSEGSSMLAAQSFSREYEQEADDAGWESLVAANIDPRGAIRILQRLRKEAAIDLPRVFQRLSTHPPTEERIQRLESKWSRLKRKSGFVEFDTTESK